MGIVITACLYLISCNNEIPSPDTPLDKINENANSTAIIEANRMEIPRLKGGTYDQFIVKRARLRDNSNKMFVNFCM